MAHLIDKDKVIEEVNHHLKIANTGIEYAQSGIKYGLDEYKTVLTTWEHCQSMCKNILAFLDTLETKEVDLEKECKNYLKNNFTSKEAPDEFLTTLMQLDDMVLFAKHFYELGLKTKGE